MKAEIISNSPSLVHALERYLRFVHPDEEVEDLIIVDINSVLDDVRDHLGGFEVASVKERVQNSKNIVMLFGVEDESFLMKNNHHFAGLMTYSNVDFINIFIGDNVLLKYQELASGQKKQDTTGLACYEFQEWERAISGLRHGLDSVLTRAKKDPSILAEWLQRARKAGLTGSDEEIIKYVQEWSPETYGEFKGKFLEGIFVDAFETLFDKDWKIVHSVRAAVEKMSDENQKVVFVISDSDKDFVEQKLNDNNVNWRLISKYDIRGAILEVVIDNMSQEDFESTYGIQAQKFINVVDL